MPFDSEATDSETTAERIRKAAASRGRLEDPAHEEADEMEFVKSARAQGTGFFPVPPNAAPIETDIDRSGGMSEAMSKAMDGMVEQDERYDGVNDWSEDDEEYWEVEKGTNVPSPMEAFQIESGKLLKAWRDETGRDPGPGDDAYWSAFQELFHRRSGVPR
jgi:hypothetical protein